MNCPAPRMHCHAALRSWSLALSCLRGAAEDAREIVRRSVNVGDENLKARPQLHLSRTQRGPQPGQFGACHQDRSRNLRRNPAGRLALPPPDLSRRQAPASQRRTQGRGETAQNHAEARRKETPAQREKRLADYDRKREQERAIVARDGGRLRLPPGGRGSSRRPRTVRHRGRPASRL